MVGRYRENTQENIRPWGLLISGWKKQGKYSGSIRPWGLLISGWKKQGKYSGSIRPWGLLISGWKIQGKYLAKHQTPGVIDQWLEHTGKIVRKAGIKPWGRKNFKNSITPLKIITYRDFWFLTLYFVFFFFEKGV